VIKAAGKDTRGNGTASATVTVTLRAEGEGTAGSVDTDLSITGKPAQFGRGLISEVGGKILDSFASCLATKLAPDTEPADTAPPATASPKLSVVEAERADAVAVGAHAGEEVAKSAPPAAGRKPRLTAVESQPESEPIDLLAFAGPSVVKRVVPLVAALVLVLAVVRLLRRRS
jgi:hypothetical protein